MTVMNPSTIVVAELVPEVDLGDVVMGVDQLVSVEVAVEHNRSRSTDTNCGCCGPMYNRGCCACSGGGPS